MIRDAAVTGPADGARSVSVVIPFYNASHTLGRALDSIASQTLAAEEILVVDDASRPEEVEAAERIIAQVPGARLVRLAANGGPSRARNHGVDLARGTFVAFLDADDAWSPEKLQVCVDFLSDQDADFVGHNNTIEGQAHRSVNDRLRPADRPYAMTRWDLYFSTSQFAPSTVVFRRSLNPRFDETARLSEDYRLWGDLIFSGARLWKLQANLGARYDQPINGAGLSGNAGRMLAAHTATVRHFRAKGFITPVEAAAMIGFLKLKFMRH